MPHAGDRDGWVSAPAAQRVRDFHDAFLDDDVSVVLASIGGNHSNQMLPLLDYDLIRSHPKLFQGFSDNTVLHWALLEHAGLCTLYGPALVLEMAEYPKVLDYTDRYLRAAWFGDEPVSFKASEEWTDEFLDFETRADLERARVLRPNSGWEALRPGAARGPLVGGCLETICWHLKGSTEWLDLDGAILFLETSEEAPSPSDVDAYLADFENLGVFEQIGGLVFGRPAHYQDEDVEVLHRVIQERTATSSIPVLANLDCGHTDPMLTLPLGAEVRVDSAANVFETTEAITSVTNTRPRAR